MVPQREGRGEEEGDGKGEGDALGSVVEGDEGYGLEARVLRRVMGKLGQDIPELESEDEERDATKEYREERLQDMGPEQPHESFLPTAKPAATAAMIMSGAHMSQNGGSLRR